MTLQEFVKASSCRIKCNGNDGSGFFITSKTILTCYHVVKDADALNAIEVFDYLSNPVSVELINNDTTCDVAILNVTSEYSSAHFLQLCESEIVPEVSWVSFGYPSTLTGRLVGQPLNGQIVDTIIDSSATIHDTTLSIQQVNAATANYDGFSGSPIVDLNRNVISILRYQDPNYLSALSIKKAAAFLKGCSVAIKQDELCGFDEYLPLAFDGFESDPKLLCNSYAAEIVSSSSPNKILANLLGSIFFPNRNGTSQDLVANLKRNSEQSARIWVGWLEFLSHVALLKGEHSDANAITITLSSTGIFKTLGLAIGKNKPVKLKLRFLWTETETYFEVAQHYLHKKLKTGIEHNSCHIFNSKLAQFGGTELAPGFKNKIIDDISSPKDSGYRIKGMIDFGILSLAHLNNEVKSCSTLSQATENLEKLFRDAIEHS